MRRVNILAKGVTVMCSSLRNLTCFFLLCYVMLFIELLLRVYHNYGFSYKWLNIVILCNWSVLTLLILLLRGENRETKSPYSKAFDAKLCCL